MLVPPPPKNLGGWEEKWQAPTEPGKQKTELKRAKAQEVREKGGQGERLIDAHVLVCGMTPLW